MTNKFPQTDDNSQKAAARNDGGFFSGARAASCRSLYVHVPFCERKCNYCAFESAPPRAGDFELYLASLRKELALRRAELGRLTLGTCYIGGGTPTALPPLAWDALIETLEEYFDFAPEAEVTVEANPNSLRAEHLLAWREWRVTRVSVGVQSFDGAELEMMGRLHGAAQAHEALSAALAAGFAVNADFIFGLPHQSLENWARTLREAVRCGLSHISLYQLSLEEGTPWENLPREVLPDGYAQYRWAQWYLPRHGYEQYEIANFARAGRESRHNLNYWREGEYLGIGPGAASYINGARMKNSGLLHEYAAALDAGRLPIRESERLDAEARGREAAVLALRTAAGIERAEFAREYGAAALSRVERIMGGFPKNLYESDERGIRLTKSGMRVANLIWEELV
ncbi:radical SAM family heme chaperone HemW [uncultured Cloacibacillus sp.]|uniref:radical SAM family heme chaperone HemW n=1 Tax=uncultured Cloacibacillus sp. TaxID=889794 RepID=UPI0025D35345|nr:radical SAM family heme chaperone HemW [uncultured Cloacibacillus sp.]